MTAIYYDQIDEVMSGFFHEIQVLKNDLSKFEEKYKDQKEVPDNITFAINSRKMRVQKLLTSYHFIKEYVQSMYEEMEITKQEKRQLVSEIRENEYFVTIKEANRKAYERPIPRVGTILELWARTLEQKNKS